MSEFEPAPFDMTIQCKMYHPLAQRFSSMRNNAAYHCRGVLTVGPDGDETFSPCQDSQIHDFLYPSDGGRIIWRTDNPAELAVKLAAIMEVVLDAPRASANSVWGITEMVIPTERQVHSMMQLQSFASDPIADFRLGR